MRTITANVVPALDVSNTLGETPVWSERDQALYWINCQDPPELLRWSPVSGELERWAMPERVGGLVLKAGGGALVVLASGLFDFDFDNGALKRRASSPLSGDVALHECACDRTGRLWVGAIDHRVGPENLHPGGAKLFRLDGDKLVSVVENMSCTNGLAFSIDGRTMYVSDSTTRRCDRYDVDPVTGKVGPRETFFELEDADGFVDGATIDAQEGYWATLVYAGKLRRYLSDGTPDIEVQLPFDNPTKPAFGGEDLSTMFITSTNQTLGGPAKPLDGGLFMFEPGFKGRPEPMFAG